MTSYEHLKISLQSTPKTWLVTGVAGFIGSNLLLRLLDLDQKVVGLDDFSTGNRQNLDEIRQIVGEETWARFRFIEGSTTSVEICTEACTGADVVLHQAALGSVPRSLKTPLLSHGANVDGFINMLEAARNRGVPRFVYASSSSVYGSHPALPKLEPNLGDPLSPYAATKLINEIYAKVYSRCYNLETVGLRYFNVFGPRQTPHGAYAAVIPRWIGAMINDEEVVINGDGETSRDFCFIENVIQANILAAMTANVMDGEIINIAAGGRTSLNELYDLLVASLAPHGITPKRRPRYSDFREGDVRHSLASIDKAKQVLGYVPAYDVRSGLRSAAGWYIASLSKSPTAI